MKTSYLRLLLLDHLIFIALLKLFSMADEAPLHIPTPLNQQIAGSQQLEQEQSQCLSKVSIIYVYIYMYIKIGATEH